VKKEGLATIEIRESDQTMEEMKQIVRFVEIYQQQFND
jgi:hypothetical protein